ncbi:MAG: hypothetical protein ACRYE7_00215 [Janthinobacterium lividum]
MKVMTCMDGYKLDWDVDPRRMVSLACMPECADLPIDIGFGIYHANSGGSRVGDIHRNNRDSDFQTCMEAYVSKLSLMCLNVNRLVYTTRAFSFRKIPDWNVGLKALDFYLRHDTSFTNHQLATNSVIGHTTNLDFSTLLHRLRSSGYLEYIVELGRCLEYDVEVVLGHDKQKVYVYKYVGTSVVEGVLTAYYNETQWYVYISKHSRVRTKTDIVDLIKR